MSDFEAGVMFVEFLNTSNVVFANYMTLIFAVLTANWFLARRMTRAVAVCFLTLFTLAALAIGSGVFFAFSDFFALQVYLDETRATGGDLRWLGPVRVGGVPPLAVMQGTIAAIVVFSWAGAIAFFFVVRRDKAAPGRDRD
jgi:hypothetical protein